MKQGHPVSRAGWNGKGMFIYLNKGAVGAENVPVKPDVPADVGIDANLSGEFIEGIRANLFEVWIEGIVTRLPNINMKAATGSTVTGWLASQTDMLAEDWGIYIPAA